MRLVLKVKCPRCGYDRQQTESVTGVTCFNCNKPYYLFPKNKRSNIISIEEGTMEMLHKRLWELKNKGR